LGESFHSSRAPPTARPYSSSRSILRPIIRGWSIRWPGCSISSNLANGAWPGLRRILLARRSLWFHWKAGNHRRFPLAVREPSGIDIENLGQGDHPDVLRKRAREPTPDSLLRGRLFLAQSIADGLRQFGLTDVPPHPVLVRAVRFAEPFRESIDTTQPRLGCFT
jgi:hypothetical protein